MTVDRPLFDDPSVREPYLEHYETLRGRVRTAIVQRHLTQVLPAIDGPDELMVLDVGCGDGRDSVWLAEKGHRVTAYDTSREMLDDAESKTAAVNADVEYHHGTQRDALRRSGAGTFDLVLSHGVIMYQEDPAPFISEHMRLTREHGMLSLLAKNRDALVHRAAREASLEEAIQLLDDTRGLGHLGVETSAQSIQELADLAFRDAGTVRSWAGVRMFTDTPTDAIQGAEDDRVIELEWRACRRDPHRQVAALLHVILQHGIDLSLLPA